MAHMTTKLQARRRLERLAELEEIIERHLVGFMEVGKALLEIRTDKLYRETHPTFEAWCKLRFNIGRRRAYELMAATEVRDELVRHGAQTLPDNERQTRELTRLAPAARPVVWDAALELAEGEPVTEKHVRRAVREHNRQARVRAMGVVSAANPTLDGVAPVPIILADPPWEYDSGTVDPTRVIENQYPTMSIDELKALDVASIATADAVLFMWAPPALLPEALEVMAAWGFTYKTNLTWDKKRIGGGYWFRIRHEHLLLGVRGNPAKPPPSMLVPSVIAAARGKHSAKPGVVHEMIERYYPTLPKLELFCRAPRKNWTAWGNQAQEKTA